MSLQRSSSSSSLTHSSTLLSSVVAIAIIPSVFGCLVQRSAVWDHSAAHSLQHTTCTHHDAAQYLHISAARMKAPSLHCCLASSFSLPVSPNTVAFVIALARHYDHLQQHKQAYVSLSIDVLFPPCRSQGTFTRGTFTQGSCTSALTVFFSSLPDKDTVLVFIVFGIDCYVEHITLLTFRPVLTAPTIFIIFENS